jgi:hypothetical protein
MFWIFLAICWACAWCFDNSHPILAIVIGVLFANFYLINRWINLKHGYEDEDDL